MCTRAGQIVLKHGEVNPLNVFGLRKLEHCPPHFEQVTFWPNVNEKHVSDWIYENLSGRFYVGYRDIQTNRALERHIVAAFENASEASYFSLFLPQINPVPNYL